MRITETTTFLHDSRQAKFTGSLVVSLFLLTGLRRETRSATAASTGIRVHKSKSSANEVSGVIKRRSAQEGRAFCIADNGDSVHDQFQIYRLSGRIQLHHILKTRATTAFHTEPKEHIWATIFSHQSFDVVESGRGDLDWESGGFHGVY